LNSYLEIGLLCFIYDIISKKHMACYHYLVVINPLNTELNPICHLLALLEAHHILHVSRIRVNIVGIFK